LAKKKRKRQTRGATRRPIRRKRSALRTYGLIAAAVVVVVAVIVIVVALTRGRSPGPTLAELAGQSLGSADAPVVVVEYADYQCPYCRQFYLGPEQQLVKDYVEPGKVRFVFRNFAFIGNESFLAAEAAQCAADQGQFWAYHDLLFEKQGAENSGVFSQSNLEQYAASLGLDTTQFDQCLSSGRYLSLVQQQSAEAQRAGISSTPTILVNGQVVANGASYPALQAAIEAALKGQ
jgi:protein-disulfide isomerase